ncbi:hypothetical protein ACHHYP_14290 [Achlya hypogyna]|uniref:RING-type E3 ubiquitin transferase n=1 Tax=Achlya hypogyna TaxID=1202772 RepID=A0A1V9YDK5_ACHHY|nr:hypothetical protein ACHHYP_14290 [Achlya hypogyna]
MTPRTAAGEAATAEVDRLKAQVKKMAREAAVAKHNLRDLEQRLRTKTAEVALWKRRCLERREQRTEPRVAARRRSAHDPDDWESNDDDESEAGNNDDDSERSDYGIDVDDDDIEILDEEKAPCTPPLRRSTRRAGVEASLPSVIDLTVTSPPQRPTRRLEPQVAPDARVLTPAGASVTPSTPDPVPVSGRPSKRRAAAAVTPHPPKRRRGHFRGGVIKPYTPRNSEPKTAAANKKLPGYKRACTPTRTGLRKDGPVEPIELPLATSRRATRPAPQAATPASTRSAAAAIFTPPPMARPTRPPPRARMPPPETLLSAEETQRRQAARESLLQQLHDLMQRFGNGHDTPQTPATLWTSRAPQVLACLPTQSWPRDPCVAHSCIVCQEEYARGDFVVTLPCAHLFHHACAKPWILENNECPLCKIPIHDASRDAE